MKQSGVNMPEEGRRESGFTFVELVISMAITALIVPAMFVMLGQLDRLPTRNTAELGASNEVRLAGRWIASDASMALSFANVTDTFTMVGGNVTYWRNPATNDLMRTETGANPSSIAVASNVDAFDLSQDAGSDALVKATLTATRDAGGVDVSEEATVYGVLRKLSGGFDSVYKTIFTSGGSIEIHSDATIVGNMRANGDVKLTGGKMDGDVEAIGDIDNQGGWITGDAKATGGITVTGGGQIDGIEYPGASLIPMNPAVATLPSIDFLFSTGNNIDLGSLATDTAGNAIWEDPTTLKAGVYYASKPNAKISLKVEDVSGQVTLIANNVDVGSKNSLLTPYYGGILLWAKGSGPNAIQVTGSAGSVWEGILYAPDGEIHIVSGLTIRGGVAGESMDLGGGPGGEMLDIEIQ